MSNVINICWRLELKRIKDEQEKVNEMAKKVNAKLKNTTKDREEDVRKHNESVLNSYRIKRR